MCVYKADCFVSLLSAFAAFSLLLTDESVTSFTHTSSSFNWVLQHQFTTFHFTFLLLHLFSLKQILIENITVKDSDGSESADRLDRALKWVSARPDTTLAFHFQHSQLTFREKAVTCDTYLWKLKLSPTTCTTVQSPPLHNRNYVCTWNMESLLGQ